MEIVDEVSPNVNCDGDITNAFATPAVCFKPTGSFSTHAEYSADSDESVTTSEPSKPSLGLIKGGAFKLTVNEIGAED